MWSSPELSCSVYRTLLVIYPRALRTAFGQEMVEVFGQQIRNAASDGGTWGVLRVWFYALYELFTIALPLQAANTVVIIPMISLISSCVIFLGLLWTLQNPAMLNDWMHRLVGARCH